MTVRVRIAPSPTGSLHVGNARAGLFNWLFARHHGGTFILRVDDTDTARSEERFVDELKVAYAWLGLDWDEGPEIGGPHGTYRQSDRFDRYAEVAQGFLDAGTAFRCFCTPAELDERRNRAQKDGRPARYDGRCTLLSGEDSERRSEGESFSIRFKFERPGDTVFQDLVRDEMRFDHELQDDFVIVRSSGVPTYHLASTVDDVDYEITHVARGEDLLSSTPKHIAITQALGAEPAIYAHLPLLFGSDGKKLSKRHGDTSMAHFIEGGYLPEAMFNFMCLLGWSLDGETEIFDKERAIAVFNLDDVNKNAAVFDTKKLEWLNGEYIRALDPEDFIDRTLPLLAFTAEQETAYRALAPLVQERVKLLSEVPAMVSFLSVENDDIEFEDKAWAKVMAKEATPRILTAVLDALAEVTVWDTAHIEEALRGMIERLEIGMGRGLQPIRVSITGSSISPPLFESLEALGRSDSLIRVSNALKRFE